MELEHFTKELSCNSIRNVSYGSSIGMGLEVYDVEGNGPGRWVQGERGYRFWKAKELYQIFMMKLSILDQKNSSQAKGVGQ